MQDWVLGLGVLVFVTIDLILLFLNITIGEVLGASTAIHVPNRDNPRTVTGVSIKYRIFHTSPLHETLLLSVN